MHTYLKWIDIATKWLIIGTLGYSVSTILTLFSINGVNTGDFGLTYLLTNILDSLCLIIFIVVLGYFIIGIFLISKCIKEKRKITTDLGYKLLLKGIILTVFIYLIFITYNSVIAFFGIAMPVQYVPLNSN
jgi:hypothetical protein